MIGDFFNKNKEYISCEWLEYGINISPNGIEYCCMYNPKSDKREPVVPIKNGQYDIKSFLKIKKQVLKKQKKGIINPGCIGCYNLQKGNWNTKDFYKYIVVNLNYKCNSDCCYCFTHKNKLAFNSLKEIPLLNIIKKGIKKKLILPNSEIHLGGGEPTLHTEFEDILNELLDYGCNNIKIYSSGVKYSKAIEKAIDKNACKLYISTDSGTEKLYKRIKNINKYNEVWNNIEAYSKKQGNENTNVWIKYIIIPDINDNIESAKDFTDKVKMSGCKGIVIDIEREWYSGHENNEQAIKRIIPVMKYLDEYAKKNQLERYPFPSYIYIMNKYEEYYNNLKVII